MKKFYPILFLFLSLSSHAQDKFLPMDPAQFNHAKVQLIYAKEDTNKVRILDSIGWHYCFYYTDSALMYLDRR
jgi:hypothetical protein